MCKYTKIWRNQKAHWVVARIHRSATTLNHPKDQDSFPKLPRRTALTSWGMERVVSGWCSGSFGSCRVLSSGRGAAPEDEARSGCRSHWNLGVWALFQVLHAVPEQYLWWLLGGDAGEWGRCAWMVGVCKKTKQTKTQRFPGRTWMMNVTHFTWKWFKSTASLV